MKTLTIKNSCSEVEIFGCFLKSFKVFSNTKKYELLGYDKKNHAVSFVMAPWANRIKNGKFDCTKGNFNLLASNPFVIQHAIHGTAIFSEWNLVNAKDTSVVISTDLADPWPFKGKVELKIYLDGASLNQELLITNNDTEIMPFSMGWHPWFNKYLGTEEVELIFDAKYKWETTSDDIPTSKKVITDEILKAKKGFSPKPGTLNECYRLQDKTNAYLKWPELTLKIQSSSECGHLMVYTPNNPLDHLLCVEPQTATINCFQLNDNSVDDTGILFVEPGKNHLISTNWSW